MRAIERVPGAELMDRPDVAPEALAQGLADLRRVNRWFGGSRAALSAVLPLAREPDVLEVRVLDIATGSGDIPLALSGRARREGLRLQVVATDLHPETVAAARANLDGVPGVEVARADALALPFDDGDFHLVMCHTALHHFDSDEAVRLLREMARVASHGMVVTDLARSRTAIMGVSLMARTLWRAHPVTRHDSVVSIRGAYTAKEVAALTAEAGWRQPRIRHHPFFRFSLASRHQGSAA